MFGNLPPKHRPNCNKLDENGLCPKGVPNIPTAGLSDFWQIYSLLSTQSISPDTGLLRFDSVLVKDLCSLYGLGERETAKLSALLVFAVDEANSYRLERLKEKKESAEMKVKGTEKPNA